MLFNGNKDIKHIALDDLESLLYEIMSISKLKLPLDNLVVNNFNRNEIICGMKENFDPASFCGEEFKFLALACIYLKKAKKGKHIKL